MLGLPHPQADVLALLSSNKPTTAVPKLGPAPLPAGKSKIRSGVSVPAHLKARDALAGVHDWDELDDPSAAPRKQRRYENGEDAEAGFLFSSDDEGNGERDAAEAGGEWVSGRSSGGESDLEIEPPITVELE